MWLIPDAIKLFIKEQVFKQEISRLTSLTMQMATSAKAKDLNFIVLE